VSRLHLVERTHAYRFDHGTVLCVPRVIGGIETRRPLIVLSSSADLIHHGWFTAAEVTETPQPAYSECGNLAGLSASSHLNPFNIRRIEWTGTYATLAPLGSFHGSSRARKVFTSFRTRISALLSDLSPADAAVNLPGLLPARSCALHSSSQPLLRIPWYKRGTVIEVPQWSDVRGYWLVTSTNHFNRCDPYGRCIVTQLIPKVDLADALGATLVAGEPNVVVDSLGECVPIEERVATLDLTRFFSRCRTCTRAAKGSRYASQFCFQRPDGTCARCDGGALPWPRPIASVASSEVDRVVRRVLAYLRCE